MIYRLIAEPQGGATLEATARELAQIMRDTGIAYGRVIHNERRYDITLQEPFKIEALDGYPGGDSQ